MPTNHIIAMLRNAVSHTQNFMRLLIIALCASFLNNTAQASIIDTGDVLINDGALLIGTSAYGKRTFTDEIASHTGTRIGNSPGITGELSLTNTQYINQGELNIGESGIGTLRLVRDNTVVADQLTVGKTAGSNGSIVIWPSRVNLGSTGKAIIGDAGNGNINMDGAQFSETIYGAQLTANQIVLGAQPGGRGSLAPSCQSYITLIGDSPTLVIGDLGIGTMQLGVGAGPGFCEVRLSMQPAAASSSQIFVARKPGGEGSLTFLGGALQNARTLRIGMDELDQTGGLGLVNVNGLQSELTNVTIAETKIGPQGTLNISSAIGRNYDGASSSSFTSNVHNRGTVRGNLDATIIGNLDNYGTLIGSNIATFRCYLSEEAIRINGNLTQTSTGQQTVEIIRGPCGAATVIGGTIINGQANYDGTLNIIFRDGSQLTAGNQFNVIRIPSGNAIYAPSFAINFDTSGLSADLDAVADVSPTGIVVRIIPKTGTFADLAISASSPNTALLGQTLNYTYSVTNNGPSPATAVMVTGTLPSCALGDIPAGGIASCVRTATANSVGSISQTMSANGNEVDPNTSNNSITVNTYVTASADLGISLTAPASATQGDSVSYTIIVTNNGPSTATGVNATGSLASCSLGTIAPAASASCTRSATANAAGTLTQTMSVSGNEADSVTGNNSATASTSVSPAIAADLSLTMSGAPNPVKKGAKLVYTVVVTNNGPSAATNVSLTDSFPEDIIFEKIDASQGTCMGNSTRPNNTTAATCQLGTLNSGVQAIVTITLKPMKTGDATNAAVVSATVNDPNTANNSAATTISVYK